MKKQLLFLIALTFFAFNTNAQTISLIGSTSPSGSWSVDTDMTTTDNITYTLNNATITTATGWRISLPGALPSNKSGINAKAATRAVMRTGVRRSRDPRIIIFRLNFSPSSFIR